MATTVAAAVSVPAAVTQAGTTTSAPALELEHVVGFSGAHKDTVAQHASRPNELLYAVGGVVVMADTSDPHRQDFLHGHDEDVCAMELSEDGRLLATGQIGSTGVKGYEAQVIVWDVARRAEVFRLHGHTGQITALAYTPDGRFLASADSDNRLYVWEMETGDAICGIKGDHKVNGMRFARKTDDRGRRGTKNVSYRLVTAMDHAVRLWSLDYDIRSMQYAMTQSQFALPSAGLIRTFTAVALDDTDTLALCGSTSGDVCVFNLSSMVFRNGFQVSSNGIHSMRVVDGRLYCGSGDGALRKFGLEDNVLTLLAETTLDGHVTSIAPADKPGELIVGTSAGLLLQVETAGMHDTVVARSPVAGLVDVAFPPAESDCFVTADLQGNLVNWSLNTYQVLAEARVGRSKTATCILVTDDDLILSGWDDGCVRAFAASNGKKLWEISNGHRGNVTAVTVARNYIATGGDDGCVRVWTRTTREFMCQFQETKRAVTRMIPDRQQPNLLHFASAEGMVITLDLKAERRVGFHLVPSSHFEDMVQRNDNELELITAGTDGMLREWDCDYPQAVRSWSDHVRPPPGQRCHPIHALALSSNGRFLATGGAEEKVRVWDVQSGAELALGTAHSQPVRALAWSPDGKQLVSVGDDCCACIWNWYL